jgi:hypothetical protein
MFEIIMLLGFLLAATSQVLPEKTKDVDEESESPPALFAAKRKAKVHVFQDKKRSKSASNYLRTA